MNTKEYYYFGGDAYSAPVVAVTQNGSTVYYYLLRDYLGSITHVVDATNKNVVAEYSYDSWGRIRNPSTWENYTPGSEPAPFIAGRGFTGHEHLPWFNFINMNGRVYDPLTGQFLSPDNYVQTPDFTQNFNRYGYCLNNPLVYSDPDGEFIWIIPHIGWSKKGGLSIGISVVFGIPGAISYQIGGGYNFKSNDLYGYAGATLAFNTVYTSVSSQSGFSAGYTAGASIFSGFPVSTNFLTISVNYNISHDSWSGNISAWNFENKKWIFNPDFSMMIYPEQTTNFIRKGKFISNDKMLKYFVDAGDYQGALDYFGFEGTYDPLNKKTADPAETDFKTGNILYNEKAFSGNFDNLYIIAEHELKHRCNILSGKYKGFKLTMEMKAYEEYSTYVYNYRRQGLYLNIDKEGLGWRINAYGTSAGINPNIILRYQFNKPWWHFIYRIPRKW
ncbi:MAG TPA: RHS repeat-associated core domain-containing protein [Bacteroidales bacterium]|nr:RHS repeat-associated core domain-containing protein [Bacteroidales bacterium]HOK74786.1 RHS repeat-associated core domain-containing protein [Bacteroidales bacterium]HRU57202.1 RHS repeat-associated core domain-containing protein [Bacteroidales bacterium]